MEDLRKPEQAERLEARAHDAYHSRREFLIRTAATAGLTATLGLTLEPDTVVAEAARLQRRRALPSARNMPIDTFVVMMMENRSFDHYLGWYPGADGRQAGLEFTDSHGVTHATHRLADFYQSCGFLDPDHSWDGGRTEYDRGRMDGFLRAASDVFSIGYYAEQDLPFTPHNAIAFTVFDRFFCSLLGPTYTNREYMWAAQSFGRKDNSLPISSSQQGFPDQTIFNLLDRAGVSNRYYFSDIPFSALFGIAGIKRSSPVQVFYEQAAAGTLPHVSFVDPSFAGEDQGTSGDEHPLADVRVGQAWMADVVHACMESPQWPRIALFCIYDEWGGFYDHVAPPRVPDIRASSTLADDFGQMGFRVPAILASPYARAGHVDHNVYGFESILKLIRYRFGLPPLTTRDLFANNIGYAFDFTMAPRLTPPSLPSPPLIITTTCKGAPPVDSSGGVGVDAGAVLASSPGTTLGVIKAAERKPHDAYSMVTSGYLERLGFEYRPPKASDIFRHPSKMGFPS